MGWIRWIFRSCLKTIFYDCTCQMSKQQGVFAVGWWTGSSYPVCLWEIDPGTCLWRECHHRLCCWHQENCWCGKTATLLWLQWNLRFPLVLSLQLSKATVGVTERIRTGDSCVCLGEHHSVAHNSFPHESQNRLSLGESKVSVTMIPN